MPVHCQAGVALPALEALTLYVPILTESQPRRGFNCCSLSTYYVPDCVFDIFLFVPHNTPMSWSHYHFPDEDTKVHEAHLTKGKWGERVSHSIMPDLRSHVTSKALSP